MKQTQPMFLTAAGWLHALLLFWGFLPLAAALADIGGRDAVLFTASGLLLLPAAVISWYAAYGLSHLALYLLLSVAVSLAFGGIGHVIGQLCHTWTFLGSALFFALSLAVFLIRAAMRIQKGRLKKEFQEMPLSALAQMNESDLIVTCPLDVPHPVHWSVFAACYLAGALLKNSLCWHMAFGLFFADLFLYLLYHFSDSFYRFLQDHSRSANLPVKTMERIVRIIFSIAVVVLLLFALPSLFYGRSPLADWTPKEHAGPPVVLEPPETPVETSVTEESFLSAFDPQEPWIPPRWLTILSDVFLYLVSIGTCLGILWLIYRSCRKAGDFFASGTEDEIVFIDKGFSDESTPLRKTRRRAANDGSGSLMVRRLYKKTIRRAGKLRPNRAHTPAELEHAAGLADNAARELLHDSYEKARYSREGCTVQEAAEAKKAASTL